MVTLEQMLLKPECLVNFNVDISYRLVGKAALNNTFGTPYISQGYISLELQPRIYISADIADVGERLCLGLGFPRSSLKLVDGWLKFLFAFIVF